MANPGNTITRLASLLIGLCLLCGRPANASVKLPHCAIRNIVLANGLRVLMEEDRNAPVAGVQVWYHVGSKNELPGKTGFAHLFEHLMFDGTTNLGPEQFSDYIVRSGGVDNAYTTEDATVFWETVPSNNLPVALWLEADRMRNLQINEHVFKTEREVVKEERRLRFDNQPYGSVVETLYHSAFQVHPYRHQTIGSMEDLDRASVADIRKFYDMYYVPSNATHGTPDAYPLRLAAKILSEGDSSRIYRRLVYEKQIALDAQSTGNFTEDPNLFFVLAILNAGHLPAEGERQMEVEIDRLKSELVPAQELDKAKNQILRDFILSRETVKARGEELGYDSVVLKDAELVNTELARFLAVTPEDIQRVARKYFVRENVTIVEVMPETNQEMKSGK